QRRVELLAGRADDAVRGPTVNEIGRVAEVRARVDVVVLGGHDVVPVAGRHCRGDAGGHRRAAADRERTALAEVVLHVDDDECPAHGLPPTTITGMAGSPAESLS